MKLWPKEWIKEILIIILLIGFNIIGAIFFELGNIGILFLTGFLSVVLSKNSANYYRFIPLLIILIATLITYGFIFLDKLGDKISDLVILATGLIIFICFSFGAVMGFFTSTVFITEKGK